MPLDTGAVANDFSLSWTAEQDVVVQVPTLNDGQHIGDALRLVRDYSGRNLDDLAEATRIRRQYLVAIEQLDLGQLPSRPFTIGYVRAYAAALGQDGDRAVARFRRDAPDPDEPLRAPVGVRREGDPRLMLVAVCGLVVVGGILVWNFVQRAASVAAPQTPPPVAAPLKIATSAATPPQGPVTLGAPLPPPQESTTPKPYVTPGLEGRMSNSGAAAGGDAADQATAAGLDDAPAVGSAFMASGTIFGDASLPAGAILQARKPVSLTVHRPDGSIAFARFLSSGQAYRAPGIEGWTVEASEPTSVDVFVGGVLKGPMPAADAAVTDLAKNDG